MHLIRNFSLILFYIYRTKYSIFLEYKISLVVIKVKFPCTTATNSVKLHQLPQNVTKKDMIV
ncbi:hypothetical protein AN964_01255 [Heyndrickxia shackletonii]|uniref:Uncharacterized protein n=1 Tax=Heyndrickxia shackletonii TaxID=157838 RepID=A0A0Q3TDW6_9BACI|nr:hypothetical protein AN964_01255 [Heyndrickxia shackletonii]